MSDPTFTHLPAGPGADLWDFGIVEATEIVLGDAVVVIAKHKDGSIGIGNVVRRSSQSPERARQKCLEHALGRIASHRHWRAQVAEAEART